MPRKQRKYLSSLDRFPTAILPHQLVHIVRRLARETPPAHVQLQQLSADLAMQIEDLRIERAELLPNPMMDLKIQVSIARSKGQDLLAQMASDLQTEYWALMQRLDELRNEIV